ncbi:hypothetical protein D9C73_005675 [Collichthys lucidus]|uniref:Uncharacterized protein n=1 Tax=Collichthys lucidus TaxID=240159 RepID=A0A4U5U911_COLLU|nr:hypothetical protein D9C73_005675 [Collichthys lucidus]
MNADEVSPKLSAPASVESRGISDGCSSGPSACSYLTEVPRSYGAPLVFDSSTGLPPRAAVDDVSDDALHR